jgi:hypothetical protein
MSHAKSDNLFSYSFHDHGHVEPASATTLRRREGTRLGCQDRADSETRALASDNHVAGQRHSQRIAAHSSRRYPRRRVPGHLPLDRFGCLFR